MQGKDDSKIDDDDNKSLMEYRERREEWNKIIDHRQKIAQHIFNTVDTKELFQIQEPLDEDQDDWEHTGRGGARRARQRDQINGLSAAQRRDMHLIGPRG